MGCKDHGRTKSLRPEGYALVGLPGVAGRCVNLHRLVYCEYNGVALEDIKGLVVRHKCDNPRCIEPTHLIIGTRADNNKDRAERNRSAKVRLDLRVLSKEDAALIRKRYSPARDGIRAPNGVTQMARDYGVDIGTILNILRNRTHVSDSSCRP